MILNVGILNGSVQKTKDVNNPFFEKLLYESKWILAEVRLLISIE